MIMMRISHFSTDHTSIFMYCMLKKKNNSGVFLIILELFAEHEFNFMQQIFSLNHPFFF